MLRAVLDSSAQILFLTEMFRGMSLTLKYFFEPKITVRTFLYNARSSKAAPPTPLRRCGGPRARTQASRTAGALIAARAP